MNTMPWLMTMQGGHQGSAEIDALETDVMRFMAILGLCLMAIFSIVQSLPYQAAQKTPGIESKPLLQNEVQQLQEQIGQLKDQITRAHREIKQSEIEQQQQRQNMQEQRQETESTLQQTKQQQHQVQQDLDSVNKSLTKQQQRLTEIEKELHQEQVKLGSVRIQIATEKQKLQTQQQLYQQIKQEQLKAIEVKPLNQAQEAQVTQEVSEQQVVETPAAVQQPPKPKKIGFSLRFESDQALLQLLQRKKMALYVLLGKNAWVMQNQGGQWQVQNTQKPQQYYQMAAATVPPILHSTVHKQLSANASTSLVWGVTLPFSTKKAFNRLMRGQQGGDLVIDGQGRVQLQN